MTELPFPLAGSTLLVGPSGAGKTRTTARALERWLDDRGSEGTIVFEFGPELKRDDRVVGRRLERFITIPDGVWVGRIDANAPRSEGATADVTLSLARENAERANRLLDTSPATPTAVFVNDATIAFQHDAGHLDRFLAYCAEAECVVVNAYEGEEFGVDDTVSRRERTVLNRLRIWADRMMELG